MRWTFRMKSQGTHSSKNSRKVEIKTLNHVPKVKVSRSSSILVSSWNEFFSWALKRVAQLHVTGEMRCDNILHALGFVVGNVLFMTRVVGSRKPFVLVVFKHLPRLVYSLHKTKRKWQVSHSRSLSKTKFSTTFKTVVKSRSKNSTRPTK